MRINKYLSRTGICSRRAADQLIEDGRVLINGKQASLGDRVEIDDEVYVDGRLITLDSESKFTYIALNKPKGIITTAAAEPNNIIDFIGYSKRIYPVGRLDKNSRGLIFLTDDGDFAYHIMRAGNHSIKEYIVKTKHSFDDRFIEAMSSGVPILDTVTNPCHVTRIDERTFKIELNQGLNRQIRRMSEACGHEVVDLKHKNRLHKTRRIKEVATPYRQGSEVAHSEQPN